MPSRFALVVIIVGCSSPPSLATPVVPAPIVQPPIALPPVAYRSDTDFGEAGRVELGKTPGEHQLQDLVALPDGSILAVGHAYFTTDSHIDACVARFDPRGNLVASFGDAGIARVGTHHTFGQQLAVDARGRIVVTGYFFAAGEHENLLLARLLPDGALDTSFGTGGITTLDLTKSDDRPSAVFLLPSGSIQVVGIHSLAGSDYDTYIARFDDTGHLDPQFGNGGVAYFDPTPGKEFTTRAVLDGNGHITIGGYQVGSASGGFVARLDHDGKPDRRFGTAGVVLLAKPAMGSVWALAVDDRGRVLLGGQTNDDRGIVFRLTATGALDREWGRGGFATSAKDDQLYDLLLPGNGAVLGVGFRGLADRARSLLVSFGPTGTVDPSSIVLGRAGDFAIAGSFDRRGRVITVGMAGTGQIRGLVERFIAKR